ncbi:hypothetical protein [Sphingobacterium sp. UBA5670]|uniref:hypothetical protein n=1 Tax=Sphingobacterium sp. UBA5670 TaxID=1947502 RepID=UPI0025F3ECCD|nr:hypothetical protein [Sphingobacterium sp. UBA5670]
MKNISQNMGHDPYLITNTLSLSSHSWHRSLKAIALLYHWQLIPDAGDLIRFLRIHQEWSNQQHYQADDNLLSQLIKVWPSNELEPRIWACLHIGPYGLIARVLMVLGRKLAILLRSDVFEEQGEIYRKQFQFSFGREATEDELIFIRADQGNPLLKLREVIRKNYDLIFFIDGQLGAGPASKGWVPVRLHRSELLLREGIAALSFWTKVPIRTAIMTIVDGQITLRLGEDVRYVNSKSDYQPALQYILDLVGKLAVEELIQWECLPTVFEHELLGQLERMPLQSFWLPFDIQGEGRLFDLATGRSVVIGSIEFQTTSQKFKEMWLNV